jgi:hypothetical protein
MMPARANSSWVILWPSRPRSGLWCAVKGLCGVRGADVAVVFRLDVASLILSTPPRSFTQARRLRDRPALTSMVTVGSV